MVESYPFYIRYLEIDNMKDNEFIKTTSNSLEAFHSFVKLAQSAELKRDLILAEKKAADFKELVLLAELKLAEAKIKMARYTS